MDPSSGITAAVAILGEQLALCRANLNEALRQRDAAQAELARLRAAQPASPTPEPPPPA